MAETTEKVTARYPAAVRLVSTENLERKEWEVARMGGLGGSDIAPVLGISKWSTALKIWRGKVWPEERERVETASTEWGTRLEPVIREAFKAKHPDFKVEQVKAILASREAAWARANVDGIVREPDGNWGILEIKTANAFSGAPDWVDGPPSYYQTQVDWYCLVTGLRFVWVVVLIGGQDYREYRFDVSEERLEWLAGATSEFWELVEGARAAVAAGEPREAVLAKWAPKAGAMDAEEVAELYGVRQGAQPTDLAEDGTAELQAEAYAILQELRAAKEKRGELKTQAEPLLAEIKEVEAKVEEIRNRLQQLANGAPAARFGSQPLYELTLKKGRASFKPTKLKEAYPAIYEELADKAADTWEPKWAI